MNRRYRAIATQLKEIMEHEVKRTHMYAPSRDVHHVYVDKCVAHESYNFYGDTITDHQAFDDTNRLLMPMC
jgi:hypothetical protein